MAKKKYTLTDEHRAELAPWEARWRKNALRVSPQTGKDRKALREALAGMYHAAKLTPPAIGTFTSGPVTAAIATCIASGVWWLRENPGEHIKLFGRVLNEDELITAARTAAEYAVQVAVCTTRGEAVAPLLPLTRSQATEQATWQAAEQATEQATRQATWQATWQATEQATEQATWQATRQAAEQATEQATRFLVRCCAYWSQFWFGGNQWSAYTGYLSFFRHIAKLDLPEYAAFQHYESAVLHGGPVMLHEKFWIACDFPEIVLRDAENRPHCATGPFTRWRDGIALYAWHGITVPAAWIENRASLAPETALTWPNVEQRRAAAEIIGWDKVISALRPTVIDEHENRMVGTLLRVDLPDSPAAQFLKVHCATGRIFVLCVPRECKTALEAQTAMWPGLTPTEVLAALSEGRRA